MNGVTLFTFIFSQVDNKLYTNCYRVEWSCWKFFRISRARKSPFMGFFLFDYSESRAKKHLLGSSTMRWKDEEIKKVSRKNFFALPNQTRSAIDWLESSASTVAIDEIAAALHLLILFGRHFSALRLAADRDEMSENLLCSFVFCVPVIVFWRNHFWSRRILK